MIILITGAFGFVGTNLSSYLAGKGFELWALDVEMTLSEAQRAQSVYQKRFSWKQVEKIPWSDVDAVIHLAGKAHDTRNTSDAKSYFDVNVGLTRNVLEAWKNGISLGGSAGSACRKGGIERKFILFSSVKAVADRVEGVLTEDAAPAPKTPYGQSKLEAEKAVQSAIGDEQSAINGYVLRPCMIHGPGNKGNLNLLYGVVSKGLPWPLGAFDNQRSFTSIGNLCAVIEAVLKEHVAPGIYQMSDDAALSTHELIDLIAESRGGRARIWHIPASLIRCIARCGDVLHLPLTSERLKKLTESYVVSNAKIKKALGWERMPILARDGMRKTLESFGGNRR
jgi:nucleoside-diphosphate-sugar epimerase